MTSLCFGIYAKIRFSHDMAHYSKLVNSMLTMTFLYFNDLYLTYDRIHLKYNLSLMEFKACFMASCTH